MLHTVVPIIRCISYIILSAAVSCTASAKIEGLWVALSHTLGVSKASSPCPPPPPIPSYTHMRTHTRHALLAPTLAQEGPYAAHTEWVDTHTHTGTHTHTQAHALLAAALEQEGPYAAHAEFVDAFQTEVRGMMSGGVLACMCVHPVLGRVVLCASAGGLRAFTDL